jgi:hypothetical protein
MDTGPVIAALLGDCLSNFSLGLNRRELAIATGPIRTAQARVGESYPGTDHDERKTNQMRSTQLNACTQLALRAARRFALDSLEVRCLSESAHAGPFQQFAKIFFHTTRIGIVREAHHDVSEGINQINTLIGCLLCSAFAPQCRGGVSLISIQKSWCMPSWTFSETFDARQKLGLAWLAKEQYSFKPVFVFALGKTQLAHQVKPFRAEFITLWRVDRVNVPHLPRKDSQTHSLTLGFDKAAIVGCAFRAVKPVRKRSEQTETHKPQKSAAFSSAHNGLLLPL